MKGPIAILTLLMALTIKGQGDYLKYPDYDLVVTKFYSKYSIKDIPPTAHIKFQKRPTGWHIAVIDYSGEQKTIKDELFWENEKGKFRKIDFDKLKNTDENQKEIDKYKNEWSKRYYRICPYYGYPGWDWDVIQEFENTPNLPDSIVYALGRAYSSYASNLLNNNSGLADDKNRFKLPNGKNAMSGQQLEKYRHYRHRAIKKFNQVAELNPKYETIVGAIQVKASNEYLTSFLDMRMYQNEEQADKEIIKGLYPEFYIAAAKNYLSSCSPNAILFTNGDNDTYPLLYVQSKYGFRTDVLVVNMSLLNTDRYINSLRETIIDAPGLPLSFTPEEIAGRKRELILIDKEGNEPMDLTELISFVKNDEHVKTYGKTDYFYVPSNKFSLQEQENVMAWEVNKRYFLRNHLMVLDIMASNKWERPVYFAITMGIDSYFGLTKYFQLEGLAYQLVSTEQEETNDQTGFVSTSIMYNNLMNRFDWSGVKTITSHGKLLCMNYRNNFHRLADALTKENKLDSAKAVLDKCIEIMPNEIVYYDFFMIPIIEDYYSMNEFEKGNNIALKLLHNLKNDIDNYFDITIITRSNHKEAALQRLKKLAIQYDQDELIKEIEK